MGSLGSGWYGGNGRQRRKRRVSECFAVVRAEDSYKTLQGAKPLYRELQARVRFPDASRRIRAELRSHPIWRHGRLFYRCSRCGRRCTRLYVPCPGDQVACRICHRLTYFTQQAHNYKLPAFFVRDYLAFVTRRR